MTTATAARRVTVKAGKEPTAYQRKKMLEALSAPHYRLPGDTNGRSLDVMRAERWIAAHTADGRPAGLAIAAGYQGFTHFRLTKRGRMALLTDAKRAALDAVDTRGSLASSVPWPTLTALVNDGFVQLLNDHGRPDPNGTAYITNLGRRLMSLPEVDETPAANILIAELAKWDVTAEIEDSEHGDQVVYRAGPVEAVFYRPFGKKWQHSATHPAWMHDSSWCLTVYVGADELQMWGPEGDGARTDSAATAVTFAEWLTKPAETAGTLLLAALAEAGVHAVRDLLSYAVALTPGTPNDEVMDGLNIKIADSAPDVDHAPDEHSGWHAWLCDSDGTPVEEFYDGTADGAPVDCATDSAAAARAIADRIAASAA
ncbi:hypothetical protein [Streptomyces sp. 11x1]|uniref:hypothetical protein n=1 Tax=Streptomyces sp. 11x1 TaxID=3038642 RepID=UPI00292D927D|nr:hypothetical protein [Streptomyces sp. 11x1]WNZ14885.1 hypothetical protein P8T65_46465 [Streptomyces sp. 11x1]